MLRVLLLLLLVTQWSSCDDEDYSSEDDAKVYKNPRNSPSAECPRDEEHAEFLGQKCLRKCSNDEDCKSKKKKCLCDGVCGMSCIKPERECDELNSPALGSLTVTGRLFGDRAVYNCEVGFTLVGLKERVCQGDGNWSGSAPECKHNVYCKTPPELDHARHNALPEQTTFPLDTTLQYQCNVGYVTNGFPKSKCLAIDNTASWFGPDISCEPRNCGPPTDPSNGWHSGDCYTYSCKVSYHCGEGYELVGRSERVCQADGSWGPRDLPACVPVECPLPESPQFGTAIYTSCGYNAVVSYECRHGYTLIGDSTRRCGADRKWSGSTPKCQVVDCGHPGPIYNGWIENLEDGTGLGASIIFRCSPGMTLIGNASSVCQIDGTWRYPPPLCLASCVVPAVAQGRVVVETNGSMDPVVVPHGHQLTVKCETRYESAAESPIVCNNGSWSQIPKCQPARCKYLPKPPKNGMVIAPKTQHGMKARFKCKDGYAIRGQNTSECRYGNWTGENTYCEEVYCPFPGYVENGKVLLVGNMGLYDYRPYVRKVTNNKQIMYECNKGYTLAEGPPGATCIGGHWSPKNLPRCVPGLHPRLRWNRKKRALAMQFLKRAKREIQEQQAKEDAIFQNQAKINEQIERSLQDDWEEVTRSSRSERASPAGEDITRSSSNERTSSAGEDITKSSRNERSSSAGKDSTRSSRNERASSEGEDNTRHKRTVDHKLPEVFQNLQRDKRSLDDSNKPVEISIENYKQHVNASKYNISKPAKTGNRRSSKHNWNHIIRSLKEKNMLSMRTMQENDGVIEISIDIKPSNKKSVSKHPRKSTKKLTVKHHKRTKTSTMDSKKNIKASSEGNSKLVSSSIEESNSPIEISLDNFFSAKTNPQGTNEKESQGPIRTQLFNLVKSLKNSTGRAKRSLDDDNRPVEISIEIKNVQKTHGKKTSKNNHHGKKKTFEDRKNGLKKTLESHKKHFKKSESNSSKHHKKANGHTKKRPYEIRTNMIPSSVDANKQVNETFMKTKITSNDVSDRVKRSTINSSNKLDNNRSSLSSVIDNNDRIRRVARDLTESEPDSSDCIDKPLTESSERHKRSTEDAIDDCVKKPLDVESTERVKREDAFADSNEKGYLDDNERFERSLAEINKRKKRHTQSNPDQNKRVERSSSSGRILPSVINDNHVETYISENGQRLERSIADIYKRDKRYIADTSQRFERSLAEKGTKTFITDNSQQFQRSPPERSNRPARSVHSDIPKTTEVHNTYIADNTQRFERSLAEKSNRVARSVTSNKPKIKENSYIEDNNQRFERSLAESSKRVSRSIPSNEKTIKGYIADNSERFERSLADSYKRDKRYIADYNRVARSVSGDGINIEVVKSDASEETQSNSDSNKRDKRYIADASERFERSLAEKNPRVARSIPDPESQVSRKIETSYIADNSQRFERSLASRGDRVARSVAVDVEKIAEERQKTYIADNSQRFDRSLADRGNPIASYAAVHGNKIRQRSYIADNSQRFERSLAARGDRLARSVALDGNKIAEELKHNYVADNSQRFERSLAGRGDRVARSVPVDENKLAEEIRNSYIADKSKRFARSLAARGDRVARSLAVDENKLAEEIRNSYIAGKSKRFARSLAPRGDRIARSVAVDGKKVAEEIKKSYIADNDQRFERSLATRGDRVERSVEVDDSKIAEEIRNSYIADNSKRFVRSLAGLSHRVTGSSPKNEIQRRYLTDTSQRFERSLAHRGERVARSIDNKRLEDIPFHRTNRYLGDSYDRFEKSLAHRNGRATKSTRSIHLQYFPNIRYSNAISERFKRSLGDRTERVARSVNGSIEQPKSFTSNIYSQRNQSQEQQRLINENNEPKFHGANETNKSIRKSKGEEPKTASNSNEDEDKDDPKDDIGDRSKRSLTVTRLKRSLTGNTRRARRALIGRRIHRDKREIMEDRRIKRALAGQNTQVMRKTTSGSSKPESSLAAGSGNIRGRMSKGGVKAKAEDGEDEDEEEETKEGGEKSERKGNRRRKNRKKQLQDMTPCEEPEEEPNGRLDLMKAGRDPNNTWSHGAILRLSCSAGYVGNLPNSTSRCIRGKWKPAKPHCSLAPCKIPESEHGIYTAGGSSAISGQILNTTAPVPHAQVVEFSCRVGYNVQGNGRMKCWHGQWNVPVIPTCIPAPCQLPVVQHGQYLLGYRPGLTIGNGSSVRFQCDTEFKPSGSETVVCVLGELRPKPPHCKPDPGSVYKAGGDITKAGEMGEVDYLSGLRGSCSPPQAVSGTLAFKNGEPLATAETNFPDGTEVTFNCITSIMGEKTTWRIICQDGNWLGHPLNCESEESPGSGQSSSKDNTTCLFRNTELNVATFYMDQPVTEDNVEFPSGAELIFRCSDIGKYAMIGSSHRKCIDGEWDGQKPSCFGLNQENDYALEKPPTILFRHEAGPIAQSNDGKMIIFPGTTLHMECLWIRRFGTPKWAVSHEYRKYEESWSSDPGRDSQLEYRLTISEAVPEDSGNYTCITPTRHSHSIELVVKAVHCSPLPNRRGLKASTDETKMSTIVYLSCQNGNSLIGAHSLVCLPSGNWSAPLPVCESMECPDLTNLSDSNLRSSVLSREVGGRAVFSCGPGHALVGPTHSTCQATGEWAQPFPTCKEVECGDPGRPENGWVQGGSGGVYKAGDLATFTCSAEYMMEGQPVVACQENGRWSAPPPNCVKACSYPGTVISGRMSAVKFYYSIDEVIEFRCDEGLTMSGPAKIRCLKTGKWSGSIPVCRASQS